MVNESRTWKLKLEIKDLLFIAFQQINSRAFTNLACLVKGMLYTLETGQPWWVLVYSVLLLTLFSGNLLRLTSCTGFIMMSYIVSRSRFLFALYKLWRTYLLSNLWGTLLESLKTQFAITFIIKVCIVISGLTFEWGMLFRSEIQ